MSIAQAQTKLNIVENETIELTLSRTDFNRLFVEGDKITSLRFPEGYLSVENDKDGSVYLDVKDDRVFTLFVTTQKGIHFSALIKVDDTTGQTIGFLPTTPKLASINNVSKFSFLAKPENELIALVNSVEKEEQKPGFNAQKLNQKPVQIKPGLTSRLVYTLADAKKMGQKFKITNLTHKPIPFEDKWFKDKDTKALLVKERIVYPNETITVVRVEEGVKHG